VLFDETWEKIEKDIKGGRTEMRIPSELVFLMGSPASGKGTHALSIMKARGITNPVVVISDLLKNTYRDKIDKGEMIDDKDVLESLIRALIKADPLHGVLVDGFPRTETQVPIKAHLYLVPTAYEMFRSSFSSIFMTN
jgi:hypothetical protein